MTIGRLHKATSKVAVPLVTNTTSAAVQTVSDCLSVKRDGKGGELRLRQNFGNAFARCGRRYRQQKLCLRITFQQQYGRSEKNTAAM